MGLFEDSWLERKIEDAIEKKEEFKFLNKTSLFCNDVPLPEEAIDFYSEVYSEKKQERFDDFSANRYAVKKTYDYLFYEEELLKEMKRMKVRKEIEKTQNCYQDTNTLMRKYVEIFYEPNERKEKLNLLNNLYFEEYYLSRKQTTAKEKIICHILAEVNEDE